jgi:hypothetical protein
VIEILLSGIRGSSSHFSHLSVTAQAAIKSAVMIISTTPRISDAGWGAAPLASDAVQPLRPLHFTPLAVVPSALDISGADDEDEDKDEKPH